MLVFLCLQIAYIYPYNGYVSKLIGVFRQTDVIGNP